MSAHVIYEGVDPGTPATVSKKILNDLLRETLDFDRVLFSDDMEMNAIMKNYDIGDASGKAINAGCDILLICHREDRQKKAIDSIKSAVEKGEITETKIEESLTRIKKLTNTFL